MRALLNVRNADVGYPINQQGRLVVTDDGIARLWAKDGTVIGELTGVGPIPDTGRGQSVWTVTGLDQNDVATTWTAKAGGCGCGK